MKLVLDACVALKTWLVNEAQSDLAIGLLADAQNQLHQLIAPDTLPVEMCHTLTRSERQGVIAKGQGAPLFARFLNNCPILYPYDDLLDRAMQLSSDARIGLFDCIYVALAEEEQCLVVSVDQKLAKSFPDRVVLLDAL